MNAPAIDLRIDNPGANATVQDIGRRGYRQVGLAKGGAMDLHAFYWANKLLGNALEAACVEILLGGFEATAESEITVAVTGADAPVTINGQAVDHWQTLSLSAGDRLSIGHSQAGRILYLALPGGVNSPKWFGSQSIVPREKIEDIVALSAGDRLAARSAASATEPRSVPSGLRPTYGQHLRLGLIPGYQIGQFSHGDRLRLTTQDYEITQQSDRMGYRLSGRALDDVPPGIVSEGIVEGALQIPGDGQPIALMNDCQTIGGYPKPGVIPQVDRYRLAQCLPGQTVRFEWQDVASSQNRTRLFTGFFNNAAWCAGRQTWLWR